jgi:aminopeptidase
VSDVRHQQLVEKLARLTVEVGANIQPDQVVALSVATGMEPLVLALTESSYRRGARFVDPFVFDGLVKRARLEHAPEETLTYVPPWYGDRIKALGEIHAARIAVTPVVDPGLLDGVDPMRAGKDQLPYIAELFDVINAQTTNWVVIPYATPGWASVVHPELEPDEALDRLWEELAHVLRLDEPDPSEAWRERTAELERAAARLNELRFDALHYEGPGTDLTVGLFPGSIWHSSKGRTVDGVEYIANLPTEEVYSAPDPERVDGRVAATRPLDLGGAVVEGLRVRFEDGRAVAIDADENAEVLRGHTAFDDGASRLGEVALVDREGRIGQVGTVFRNTLLDENAASHLALGSAYASSVETAFQSRINHSAIHVDFMVGSDDLAVTGITGDGRTVPVLHGGDWQI